MSRLEDRLKYIDGWQKVLTTAVNGSLPDDLAWLCRRLRLASAVVEAAEDKERWKREFIARAKAMDAAGAELAEDGMHRADREVSEALDAWRKEEE